MEASGRARRMPFGRPVVPEAVEHEGAGGLFGQGFRGMRGDGGLELLVTVDGAVEHEPGMAVRRVLGNVPRHVRPGAGRDQHPGFGVVDDVAGLLVGQVAVHRRQVQPGTQRGPHHVEPGDVVLREDGDVVAPAQPAVMHEPCELIRTVVQLAVRPPCAGHAVDDGRLVRRDLGPLAWIHGWHPFVAGGAVSLSDVRPGPQARVHPPQRIRSGGGRR